MSNRSPIRIMIVDDHHLVRDGLTLLLSTFDDLTVIAVANDGVEAITLYAAHQPDVVLMDLMMPRMDGLTAMSTIFEADPDAKIIALTSYIEDKSVRQAINAGATGYLLKSASPEQLASAIHAAHTGQPTIDAEAARALLRAGQPSDASAPSAIDLTNRERQVLGLLVEGKTNKAIAETLFLSPSTVRDHVSQILSKLGVSNRTEAAILALEQDLLER